MQKNPPVDQTTNPFHNYRRVIPIFGLLLYYIGSLIVSLDDEYNYVFLLQITIFSVVLIVSLQWPMNKWTVVLGAFLVIVGSSGPLAEFLPSVQNGALDFSILGGVLILGGVIIQLFTIIVWLKES